MQTRLDTLLERHDLQGATQLLQSQLSAGELLDPRTDRQWAAYADLIATHVASEGGLDDTIKYWETLLRFFLETIEPVWGHSHKGHIYFRLGLLESRRDLAASKGRLRQAREEDVILRRSQASTPEEAEQLAMHSSSYVALALLERIEDADFASPDEKNQFIENLFGASFDAAIRGEVVKPHLVTAALETVLPSPALQAALALQRELASASAAGQPFSTVSLTGTLLESVLLGVLYSKMGVTTLANGKETLQAELGPLLKEAGSRAVFPSSSVQAGFRLIHIFRNRLHPGNELRQEHKLTMRVAMTIRILFELSLAEWADAMRGAQGAA